MKHYFHMTLEELKAHALTQAKSAIDKMETESEATYLVGLIGFAESAVLRDRTGRQDLASIQARRVDHDHPSNCLASDILTGAANRGKVSSQSRPESPSQSDERA